MREYHKIETVFERSTDGNKCLRLGKFRNPTVEKTAKMFGIDVVPIVCEGTIQDGIDFVTSHPKSTMGTAMMEGVVGRPAVELRDRCGNRVIVKIKWKDFKYFAEKED